MIRTHQRKIHLVFVVGKIALLWLMEQKILIHFAGNIKDSLLKAAVTDSHHLGFE
jgi:hypothetical protein